MKILQWMAQNDISDVVIEPLEDGSDEVDISFWFTDGTEPFNIREFEVGSPIRVGYDDVFGDDDEN